MVFFEPETSFTEHGWHLRGSRLFFRDSGRDGGSAVEEKVDHTAKYDSDTGSSDGWHQGPQGGERVLKGGGTARAQGLDDCGGAAYADKSDSEKYDSDTDSSDEGPQGGERILRGGDPAPAQGLDDCGGAAYAHKSDSETNSSDDWRRDFEHPQIGGHSAAEKNIHIDDEMHLVDKCRGEGDRAVLGHSCGKHHEEEVCTKRYARRGMHKEVCTKRYARRGMHEEVCTKRYARRGMHEEVCTKRYARRGMHHEEEVCTLGMDKGEKSVHGNDEMHLVDKSRGKGDRAVLAARVGGQYKKHKSVCVHKIDKAVQYHCDICYCVSNRFCRINKDAFTSVDHKWDKFYGKTLCMRCYNEHRGTTNELTTSSHSRISAIHASLAVLQQQARAVHRPWSVRMLPAQVQRTPSDACRAQVLPEARTGGHSKERCYAVRALVDFGIMVFL